MPDSLSTQIRELRLSGWSGKAISVKLCIKPNTVIRYTNKSTFSPRALGYIKGCEGKRKLFLNLDPVEIGTIDVGRAKLYAALLYWCEGSKYPASTTLNFTTSDMRMQKLFVDLFRKGFNPVESKFKIWLQFHSDQNKQKLFKYWASVLKIPTTQFMKPRVTDKKGGRYRRVYYGTCSLRYPDYAMTLRLMGIYKRFYKRALASLV